MDALISFPEVHFYNYLHLVHMMKVQGEESGLTPNIHLQGKRLQTV